ncbi:hypothetical protein B0H14DRAFT_3584192 [Mycena olivaceomarginata]|nr:hypothetical protein B0H14DRAFT_3584192 [Mycena olivaceomarginata]
MEPALDAAEGGSIDTRRGERGKFSQPSVFAPSSSVSPIPGQAGIVGNSGRRGVWAAAKEGHKGSACVCVSGAGGQVGLVLHQTLLGRGRVWAAAAAEDAGPGTARVAAPGDYHRARGRVPVGVVFFVVVTYVPVAAQIPCYVRVTPLPPPPPLQTPTAHDPVLPMPSNASPSRQNGPAVPTRRTTPSHRHAQVPPSPLTRPINDSRNIPTPRPNRCSVPPVSLPSHFTKASSSSESRSNLSIADSVIVSTSTSMMHEPRDERSFLPTPELHKSKSSMFSSLQKVSKRNLRTLKYTHRPSSPAPMLVCRRFMRDTGWWYVDLRSKGVGDGRGRTLRDALVLAPAPGDVPSPASPVLRKSGSSASLLLHERAVSGLTGHSGVSNLCTR